MSIFIKLCNSFKSMESLLTFPAIAETPFRFLVFHDQLLFCYDVLFFFCFLNCIEMDLLISILMKFLKKDNLMK
jgi:hypothetical protein